jgi:selenocysteine lyase/cysteine desulfurase
MTTPAIRALFAPAPGTIYLDAATYGLPPRPTVAALERALQGWTDGTAHYVEDWDKEADRTRPLFARILGVDVETVALVPTVSVASGIVAAGLKPGSRVLVPELEFTSVSWPFLVAAEAGDVTVVEAPFHDLASHIDDSIDLVALSMTRSQDGASADLASIVAAAKRHGAQIFLDTTHATPFLDLSALIGEIDYVACHAYKHLLSPRGAGFMVVKRERWAETPPYLANWATGNPQRGTTYGGPLRLAPTAARYDVSYAWHSWVGTRQSLQLILEWQEQGALAPVLGLAKRLAAGLGLPEPSASIVAFKVADDVAAEAALAAAGIKCAARGGNIRLSPHVYTTEAEIDRAIEVIRPFVG